MAPELPLNSECSCLQTWEGHTDAVLALAEIDGKIASAWQRKGGRFEWQVTVPPNTTATAFLPAGSRKITESDLPLAVRAAVKIEPSDAGKTVIRLGSGSYRFAAQLD